MAKLKTNNSLRGVVLVAIFLLLFGITLLGELFSIQVVQGPNYRRLAGARHFYLRPTYPERGKITDVNGETLALTTYVYTIGITPASVRSYAKDADSRPDREEIIESFSKLLDVPKEELQTKFDMLEARYVILKKSIPKEVYDPFREYLERYSINGISIDTAPKRYYPKNNIASQIIGFTALNEQNLFGVNGIEAYYDQELAGIPGYTYGEVDHYYGGQLPYTTPTEVEPVPGNNIVLNIDSNLQAAIQPILSRYSNLFQCVDGTAAIVLDTRTGAVVAMAQDTSYDLNRPYAAPELLENGARQYAKSMIMDRGYDPAFEMREYQRQVDLALKDLDLEPDKVLVGPPTPHKLMKVIAQKPRIVSLIEEYDKAPANYHGFDPFLDKFDMEYLQSRVWQNRNVSYTYEPGSTMKSFTVGTAMEEHAFKLDEKFSDAPIWIRGFGDYAIHCHAFPNNHEYETVAEALGNSCNPVMVQLAERVGVKKFYEYAHALGFYDLTGVDLPAEAYGILHTNPNVVDLAPMSFGESNTITPLSLAAAYTVFGNDGVLMRPQVAKYLTDNEGKIIKEFAPTPVRQVYSKNTAHAVLSMLRRAFEEGIVKYANEPGYFAGGKSGTSTKMYLDREDDDYSVMSVASIFPIDEPRYVVLAIMFGPNTPKTTGVQSMTRELIRATGRAMNVPKRYTEYDLYRAVQPKEISYANGITLYSIAEYLAAKNVEFEMAKGMKYSDFFYTMYPMGTVPLNGYPVYYISPNGEPHPDKVDIPDFTGKTFEEAAEIAYQRRINLQYLGNALQGVVVSQSEPAFKDDVQQQIQKYGVIQLEFGYSPNYNPPAFKMVQRQEIKQFAEDLPVVTDPIWTTQRIYTPYEPVAEHNPYGG